MANNNFSYETHTFKSFLEKYYVVIPMVQRDYAQGRTTDDVNRVRDRFLNAIKDCLIQPEKTMMKLDFVYGEREDVYSNKEVNKLEKIIITPLDGQQRLTTLYLLHWFAARKANISQQEYVFLAHFTYDIRPSSRDFCTHLLDFVPTNKNKISLQIIDQSWFMAEWHNDPTINSMLVMLDAINDKFDSIENLWELLTEDDRIIFYYLPLSDNGLSDELYIKMNSRGKKLTAFEHFKAEFESLYERDSKESNEVNHKFDVEWVDVLFPYRDNDNTVDREFMRYFFYISHILCYKQGITKTSDEFELIKLLYDSNCNDDVPNKYAKENRNFLERAIDCWHEVSKNEGIDVFFKNHLTNSVYEKNKVATYKTVAEYRGCQNFFNACIKCYQVNNNFSYGDFLFLYGIIIYLMNKNVVQESEFIERLRILRNLIMNSNAGEIRGDADYMKDLLDEVETLILQGKIKSGLTHSFNGFQEKEEQDKMDRKPQMSASDIEILYKFEDHPLIYGFASGFGYDHLELVDTFYDLFSTDDYMLIHRAMVSLNDYRQSHGKRFYMGNSNKSTWTSLLHKSTARDGFDKTMAVLLELLQKIKNGMSLQDIIDEYINECEQLKKYSWRYYFAKYKDMLRGGEGELEWWNQHTIVVLNKRQFNGKHWISYLNVVYQEVKKKYNKEVVKLGDYGDNLSVLYPSSSLGLSSNGFNYYHEMAQDEWTVEQNKEGVDLEDRIQMAVNRLCEKIGQPV